MKFIFLVTSALLALLTHADDTEIYGAAGIDNANRINPNIMFIMDTSGSMSGTVKTTPVYDPLYLYAGDFLATHVYHSLTSNIDEGHVKTALETSESDNCSDVVATLNAHGKVQEKFQQKRGNNWNRTLQDGNNSAIRCEVGNNSWLYTGNYMNWYKNYATAKDSNRLETVTDVLRSLTLTVKDVNFGLMRFDNKSSGGMIDVPVEDIETTGPLIRTKIASYTANGGTPLTEVMHEAALYYRGESPEYGNDSNPNDSVNASKVNNSANAAYKSPIEASCQKNHIILLTDGQPSSDGESNAYIKELIKDMYLPTGLSKDCTGSGDCLDEYAYWLKNTDHSTKYNGVQDIVTYTIGGFNLTKGVDLLRRAANFGGGEYYPADDATALIKAVDSIILKILAQDTTFTAPAVSVNAFNASEHRDELYYALFRPSDTAKWFGNLKKYKITSDGFVRDVNSNLAVDLTTGFFAAGSKDYWNATDIADGPDVTQGGMANLVEPSGRRIYSENTSNNLVSFRNATSKTLLDMTSATTTETEKLKLWIEGRDVNDIDGDSSYTDSRRQIGDPLHSEPIVITYGGTDDNPDSTIYFGTNEGFVHGVSTRTGNEVFSFLPRALHKTQKIFYESTVAAGSRPYGMDGPVTAWIKDANQNNVILDATTNTLEPNEHAYLYAGMRRGGRGYYALDVSDRNDPKFLFKIEGGVTSGFDKLGQTWSRMTVAKVILNGQSRNVLLFAGGYDENQDSNESTQPDTMGNAIYMVDATTGELLWSASNNNANLNISDMVNSIPASISAIDITGDGYINYFFAADTGGRIFRFDINKRNTGASDFAQGGVIASIAGSDLANKRRFYNKPNVALVKDKEFGDYLTIAIGSGHRAHPITTKDVVNRFYVVKDYYPYSVPPSYITKTQAPDTLQFLADDENAESDKLYNVTSIMLGGDTTSSLNKMLNNGGGWYVNLQTSGEKVLAESATFAGAIIFTTFSPSSSTSTVATCGADTGTSRVYAISQRDGSGVIDLDNDGDIEAVNTLTHSGIAPRPVIIYRPGGGKTIAIGTETIDDERFGSTPPDPDCEANGNCPEQKQKCTTGNCFLTPMYWRQNEINE